MADTANALAAEHNLAVAGFDAADLDESIVAEFLAAIETVLRTSPLAHIRQVTIDTLADNALVRARPQPGSPDATHTPHWSIVLNRAFASDPELLMEKVGQERSSGSMIAGSTERPVYARTVCELGTVLDVSGGMLARGAAQRRLIAEYLRGRTGYRRTTFSRVVGGYKQWRDQLCGHSFEHGIFAPAKAVSWAFADVVLNDAHATEPAKVLHALLIDAARSIEARRADPSTLIPTYVTLVPWNGSA
ncbi:hypothetical protein [Nocardia sp. NPDC057030]|uniref:hypothetical protein n=1 Tax=Nocardia sp. NPDC057030 TaxID=3346005 RepID=UPI003634929C